MPTETLMMKDSKIDWIGYIPQEWDIKKIKFIIQNSSDGIKVGPFGSSLTDVVVGNEDGEYKIYGQANLIHRDFDYGDNFVTEKSYKQLKNYEVLPNDICVSMMGTIGKCCVVPKNIQKGIMDSHLIKIRLSDEEHPKFFEYCYESDMGFEQLLYNSKGSIMNGLNSSIVKNIYIPFPTLKEQQAIADFLDDKCQKVDKVIGEIEEQIQVLEDYKKSLITETVTKGLDKNVPMKDSGIDYLGEIPENWDISRIKYDTIFYNGDRSDEYPSGNEIIDEGIPFINSENIHNTVLDLSSCKCITEDKYNRLGGAKLKINDIIFCLRGSVGNCAINKSINAGTVASSLVAIRAVNISPDFLNYYLNSNSTTFQTSLFQNGSCAANLSAEKVSNYYICIPKFEEQQAIANFLDEECEKIDKTINDKKEQLETIKEYKKSLIYEYVTGKKRVAF